MGAYRDERLLLLCKINKNELINWRKMSLELFKVLQTFLKD